MRLISSEPEIESLVGRITRGELDLQPNFQRGEVWGLSKKQRLIDSILRDWYVPPIHIVQNLETGALEVLDGQQRLTAIRDFVTNLFPVSGRMEPLDKSIIELDGLYFSNLPPEVQLRINLYPIRTLRLVDYRPSEPAELFFRLNQPSNLTSAEQRNAFFGPVRAQIKELVGSLSSAGLDANHLGFSNIRMAYDDVLARIALAIERDSLAEKITASDLEGLYRRDNPLPKPVVKLTAKALIQVISINSNVPTRMRFNKASLFTWSLFCARGIMHLPDEHSLTATSEFANAFQHLHLSASPMFESSRLTSTLMSIYNSRVSFRVGDASSILLRDGCLWCIYAIARRRGTYKWFSFPQLDYLSRFTDYLEQQGRISEELLLKELMGMGWPQISK